jgi:hypothetical protein
MYTTATVTVTITIVAKTGGYFVLETGLTLKIETMCSQHANK